MLLEMGSQSKCVMCLRVGGVCRYVAGGGEFICIFKVITLYFRFAMLNMMTISMTFRNIESRRSMTWKLSPFIYYFLVFFINAKRVNQIHFFLLKP